MTQEASTADPNSKKAQALLQQGYIAYNNWEIEKARLLWRKAAVVDPANEEAWQALYNVIQDDEDRKVCLQNILVLNPDNQEAEQRLGLLKSETQPADPPALARPPLDLRPAIGEQVRRVVSWVVSALVVMTAVVVLFAILIQPLV